MRFALVVLSDKASAGERADACLPAMVDGLPPGSEIVARDILPDDRAGLEARIVEYADYLSKVQIAYE